MPSPTMARRLLGQFPRGADYPAVCQHNSPLYVQSLTSLSLQAILVAGSEGVEARGCAVGHRSLQEGEG